MSILESRLADRLPIPRVTRATWVFLHRWIGLAIMLFVFQVGLTGALLSFYEELDGWMLGSWSEIAAENRPMLSPEEMEERVEAAFPGMSAEAPVDAEDHPSRSVAVHAYPEAEEEAEFDEVFVNPYSGEVLGTRLWGAIRFDAAHVMPMIYRLHYTLLVQDWDGWGFWVMGIVALLWAFDHIASLIISIPRSGPFWKAMTIKWRGSAYRINFDFHRAGGLFLWVVMLMLALTGASWNSTFFGTNVIHAAIDSVTETSPYATDNIAELEVPRDNPALSRTDAREIAAARLTAEGETVHEWWIGYYAGQGVYDVWALLDAGETRWWQAAIDGDSGEIVGLRDPKDRTVGDVINDWIYPLHSGHAFGLVGQIIICLTGLATAGFCVTGFVIFLKKFRARRAQRLRARAAGAGVAAE